MAVNSYDDPKYVSYNANRERNGLPTVSYDQFQQASAPAPVKQPVGLGVVPVNSPSIGQQANQAIKGAAESTLNFGKDLIGPKGVEAVSQAHQGLGQANQDIGDTARNVGGFLNETKNEWSDQAKNNLQSSVDNIKQAGKDYGYLGQGAALVGEGLRLGNSAMDTVIHGGGDPQFKDPQSTAQQPVQPAPQSDPTKNNPLLDGIQKYNANREAAALQFQAKTGYKPGESFGGQQPLEMTQQAWGDRRAQEDGSATSSGKGGDFRYLRNENGELVKQNMADGSVAPVQNRVTHNNRQSPAAEAAGTTDAWYNNGYPGGPAQYRQESEMKKQQAALYQTLGNLQQDAMNPMLSHEARANAAQMHGQLVQHINGLGQQQVSREGNQNQHDYQLGQLGNQQRQQNFTEQQYADQDPERQYKKQITSVQQTALGQGPEADKAKSTLSALGLTNQKERFHGIALDNPSDPNGFKTGQRLGGIDIYSGQITDPGQQSEKQNDYAQLQQAIKLYPDRAKEFQDRFNQKYAVQ